jgi:peptide/nickel transport system substrate-binding protein
VSLDWNDPRSATDRFIVSFLMRGLLKYDEAAKPVCDLCKSYAPSEDGRTYRFQLDGDAVWSDGEKLDAAQFVESFRRLRSLSAAEAYRGIASVRAVARDRLEITLNEPSSTFPHLLTRAASFPIRKEFVRAKDGGVAMASGPVLGPYQLAAWERGRRIVIEGNPRYAGPRPVYRVDFVLGQHAQLFAKYRAGKVDILANPTTEELVRIPGRLTVNPYWAYRGLVFNFRRPAGGDLALRRAVLYALDRAALPSRLKNGERAVTGLVPPGLAGYRELALATADPARADAERARAAAGSGPADLELLARDTPEERSLVQWLSERLAPIRVRVRARTLGNAAYHRELGSGNFDAALRTWSFEIASPLDALGAFRTGAAANAGSWTNVAFDALLDRIARERDGPELARLVDQATQLLEVQEVAAIPLGYPTQPFLLGTRVISFAMTPFGDPDLVRIKLRGF